MKANKTLLIAIATFAALFFITAAAGASQKLKGKVETSYKDESVCKVAGELVKKADFCEKGADVKAESIVVISGKESEQSPEKDQTIILKIKGCGKTTGRILQTLDKTLTKDDIQKISGQETVVFWKNGEKGQIYLIQAKKQVTPEKGAEAKIILKKKAPKVEGC